MGCKMLTMPSRYRFWSSVSLSMSKASWLGDREGPVKQGQTRKAAPIFPSDPPDFTHNPARYPSSQKATKVKVLPEASLKTAYPQTTHASFLPS